MRDTETQSATLDFPKPYTVKMLANRWQCSPHAIREMIKTGRLNCAVIGRGYRIPVDEIERVEWLDLGKALTLAPARRLE